MSRDKQRCNSGHLVAERQETRDLDLIQTRNSEATRTMRGVSGLCGRHVVVLEDEFVIGLALVDSLEEVGMRVSGPLASRAQALDWLQADTPNLAVLDLNLKDGLCTDVAAELRRRDVPFIIASGHPAIKYSQHQDLSGAPYLQKPVRTAEVLKALQQM
jgi:DNA-binding response OmpR family regulator